jgi:hypothetical protein
MNTPTTEQITNFSNSEASSGKPAGLGRWLIILFVLVIAACISGFYAINEYSSGTAIQIKQSKENSDRFESIYKDASERRLSKLRLGVDLLLEDKEIVAAFSKNDREALIAKALPLYNDLLKKKHDVDRLSFWNPPATIFLRSEQPKDFGIDASATRKIVVEANNTRAQIVGMEPGGRGIIALRAVAPVLDGTRLVGVVELGSELDSLLKRASKTSGLEYAVGIDQKLSDLLHRSADAKNDSIQGTDVFYIFSSTEVGKLLRDMVFNSKTIEPQIVESNHRTVFVRPFFINDFAGAPTVKVATINDLTDEFDVVLRQTAIKTAILFLILVVVTLIALFKFSSLREGLNKALSKQRVELEEKAAFCEAAAEKLKDVDLLKRGYFANLTTAINEPLQAVAGTLQSISGNMIRATDQSQEAQIGEQVTFALSEITRLSELIKDYQQVELFRQRLVARGSDLISVASVVERAFADELVMIKFLPHLKLRIEIAESLPQLRVDADLLRRAISGLVNYAARGASHGSITLQGSTTSRGWLALSITGTAFAQAGAPTESLLDESRQFLSRLATEHGVSDASATLIPIVLARMVIEFYGGRIDASPADKANPGFVIYLPTAA